MISHRSSTNQRALLKLLKTVRIEAGLKQAEIAQRIGLSQSDVSKYESGERRLDILELRAICSALNITLSDFIARLEEEIASDDGRAT